MGGRRRLGGGRSRDFTDPAGCVLTGKVDIVIFSAKLVLKIGREVILISCVYLLRQFSSDLSLPILEFEWKDSEFHSRGYICTFSI